MVNDTDKYLLLHRDGETVIESDTPATPDSVVILAGPGGTVTDDVAGRYKLRDRLRPAGDLDLRGHAGEKLTLDAHGRASAAPPPPHPDAPKGAAPQAAGTLPSRANPPVVPLNQPRPAGAAPAGSEAFAQPPAAGKDPDTGRPTPPGVTGPKGK
jgi:hypothetical protein